MGSQRVDAYLQTRPRGLVANDGYLMMVICQKWNDRQDRDLDIRFPVLLDHMPYSESSRPERMLRISLRRLIELGILYVEHNGARYQRDRWLHITIAYEKFWEALEKIKSRHNGDRKEEPTQARLLQSRAMNARPESTRDERSNSRDERASRKSTRDERSSTRDERASHSGLKISKDITPKKDPSKGRPAGLQSDISGFNNNSAVAETSTPEPAPRPALVPAAALAEPETAAAVFNTLEMPEKEKRGGYDRDLAAELQRLHDFIRHPLNHHNLAGIDAAKARIKEITRPCRKGKLDDHDNRPPPETLHQVPAEQADDRVPEIQPGDRRSGRQLQGVRKAEEESQSPPQEMRAVQAKPQPGRFSPAWRPKRWPDQAVPALSYADRGADV